MSEPILTVPNQITILRMAAVPLLVVLVLQRDYGWALTVYVLAGLTDLLDGLIARSGHQSTTLGAFLDPIADKILLSATFVVLTWGPELLARIPAWLTVTTLSRDAIILVSVTVINLTHGRRVFYPTMLGKLTTASQILTAGVVLLLNALMEPFPPARYLFVLTLGLTIVSALHYVYLASRQPGLPEEPR